MKDMGKKIIVLRLKRKEQGYTDQIGRTHAGYVVYEEVELTVVETKDVPEEFNPDRTALIKDGGWKAADKDGRVFLNSWEHFASTSFTPRVFWGLEDKALGRSLSGMWQDATIPSVEPLVTDDGQPFVSKYLTECQEHRGQFFFPDDSCYECRHKAAA